jgi:hypothetical protein
MKKLCIYMLCLALISPVLTSSSSSSSGGSSSSSSSSSSILTSSSNQQQQPKAEESKLKADAKDLIKASASSNEYTQLAADYAIEKTQQQQHADTQVPETQSSYSQPLSTAASGYSQPLNYLQPIAYQQTPTTSDSQPHYEIAAAPGSPGYEQPASAAAADAYTNGQANDGPTYSDGQPQYSQQYPPAQQYQPMGPAYQPAYQPAHYQSGPASTYQPSSVPAYQPSSGASSYSQPDNYGHHGPVSYHQSSSAVIPNLPGHSFQEITFTGSANEYSNNQQSGGYSSPQIDSHYQPQTDGYVHQPSVSKPKKTVILAIPVKLVSKNKYNHDKPAYSHNHVQPAAAGIAVSHQNQDSHDNSGNAYYSSYPSHDKPVYNEKNEQPRIPNDYSEPIEKDVSHNPKHISSISGNHLPSNSKPYSKLSSGRPRNPKPYNNDEYEVSSGIEESPIEISGHEQLNYGPSTTELEPASLQALSYLPADPFNNYGHSALGGPHAAIGGFNSNPLEILYQPPTIPYGKGPGPSVGQFGFGKPIFGFGGPRPIGAYGPPPSGNHQSSNSGSSLASNYGQLINSLLSAYGIGGSKSSPSNNKPSSGGGKGITSYFNNYGLDNLIKSYSSLTPSYISSLYSSASSPTKLYLPPAGHQGGPQFNGPKPFGIYSQQPQYAPQQQSKPKQTGLIAAPSNIASAIEEMFKSTLNPVSKFRRPLYSDATKAITNFYKKLIN